MDWLDLLLADALAIDPSWLERVLLMARSGAEPWAERLRAAFAMNLVGQVSPPGKLEVVNGKGIVWLTGVLTERFDYPGYATSYAAFTNAFNAALADAAVNEIVIAVNSPGGTVAGAPETADVVYRARGQKPITAIAINGMAASAAYYVPSAADKFYATVGARVGSIGVLLVHGEFAKASQAAGETYTVLRRPPMKAAGNPYEPLSKEAADALQRTMIDPAYEQFADRVARNRGVPRSKVDADFGRGLTLPAEQALAAGMLDGLVDWPNYVGQAAEPDGTESRVQVPGVHLQASHPPGLQSGETQGEEVVKYGKKLRAWLLAHDLISDMDASDEVVGAVLSGYFGARGQPVPEGDETLLAALKPTPVPAAGGGVTPAPAASLPAPLTAENLQAAVLTAQRQAQASERARVDEIRKRATLLGLATDDPDVVAAEASDTTPSAFADTVLQKSIRENKPLAISPTAAGGEAALDKFSRAVEAALILRHQAAVVAALGSETDTTAARERLVASVAPKSGYESVARMGMVEICKQFCSLAGVTVPDRSDIGYAEAFLKAHGTARTPFGVGHPRIFGSELLAEQAGYWGPGDYPRILDGVAGKIVRFALQSATVTYMDVAQRLEDFTNWQPREIVTFGRLAEIPLHIDGQPYDRAAPMPSQAAWIMRDDYGYEVPLTPRMLISDIGGVLMRGLMTMALGHEKTLNRLVINLITGNVSWLVDGVACYSHTNDITDGGGPSATETKKMRKMLAQQVLVSDTEESGQQMAWALVGSEWMDDARVAYLNVERLVYTTDATAMSQIYRGTIKPLYDPMIGSGSTWYGGVSPDLPDAALAFAFGAGFGPGGRRVSYFDQATNSMVYRLEGSFGAVLLNAQGLVRNDGTATG